MTSGYYYPVIPRNEARAIVLEDENALLRKKIEELKKQVRSLSGLINTFLFFLGPDIRENFLRPRNENEFIFRVATG